MEVYGVINDEGKWQAREFFVWIVILLVNTFEPTETLTGTTWNALKPTNAYKERLQTFERVFLR